MNHQSSHSDLATDKRWHHGIGGGHVRRRSAWTLSTVVLIVGALLVGCAGGYLLATRSQPTGASVSEHAGGGAETWYTCGMHPNVLQKGPGDCPICQMRLTPMKDDAGGDDGDDGRPRERTVLYWRAPMDPNFISETPGKSPMGMDLVPVYADAEESGSAHDIRIDPVTIQNMGIRTAVLSRGPLVKTIRTVGRVDYDEQLVTHVHTKFEGWIEQLFVDKTGQVVELGQPLFDIYSPELYTAQQEYVAAVRSLPRLAESQFEGVREDAAKLVEAAWTKLRYRMGVTEQQIDALRETSEIAKTLAIHSPSRGIVTEKNAIAGMYVRPGMELYTIADLSHVWVYVDIYEYQLPWVRVGQSATMTLPYVPGREFSGKVVYIYPYLEKQTRVIKVRLEFDNPTLELKPEMFANITLSAELQRDALLIPREAYIDSGTRKVAFVDLGNGKFQPRDIATGVEAENDYVEVLSGLEEGEVVVTSGQFMLDVESKLREAVAKMMEIERAKTTKRPAVTENREGTGSTVVERLDAAYACPMAKHPDQEDPAEHGAYFSDEPGRCPWCGMKFAPADELDWVRARRAAEGGDVAYTCPDHQRVFAEQSGECPRCGTALAAFKAMYTCPDPVDAGVIRTNAGNCPHCGQGLAPFRGIWLDESRAAAEAPLESPRIESPPYQCSVHPAVGSDQPGSCTICGGALEASAPAAPAASRTIPDGAKYTCSMKVCGVFTEEEGECPECGMTLKPLDQVAWVQELAPPSVETDYVCPMHVDIASDTPGNCTSCGMQFVARNELEKPEGVAARLATQMDFITEHYLSLQRLLASDTTKDVALNALGLAGASETMAELLKQSEAALSTEAAGTIKRLHQAALQTTGKSIESDRVTFVDLSAAYVTLVEQLRPSKKRWPELFIFHCPMSKGLWVQTIRDKNNPYYGFKMLKCGEFREIR